MKNTEKVSVWSRIKNGLYDCKVKLFGKSGGKKTNLKFAKRKQSLFLFFFLLLPIAQFLIFYVGVNLNSFIMAFQRFDGEKHVFVGLANFKQVLDDIFINKQLATAILNSLIQFLITLFVATPLQIVVAYAIFKKIPGSGFFKIMLFMPSMISAIVFVICARVLITDGFPILFHNDSLNLLDTYKTSSFFTVLLFGFWFDFAGGLIIYLGAMSSVSKDVLEYGKLEKLSSFQELWHVIIPSIFPTIITYIIIAFAAFFISYGHFFSFFGEGRENMPYDTLGLVFFLKVARTHATQNDMSYAAAGGILFTLVVAPITILVKTLLEKYGPSED